MAEYWHRPHRIPGLTLDTSNQSRGEQHAVPAGTFGTALSTPFFVNSDVSLLTSMEPFGSCVAGQPTKGHFRTSSSASRDLQGH